MPDIQLNDPTQVATLADDDLVAVIPGQADTDPDANPPEGITKANLTSQLKLEGGFVTQTDIDDAVLIETTAREAEDTAIRTDLTALITAIDTSTNAQAIADLRTQVNGLNGAVESNTNSVSNLQVSVNEVNENLQAQVTAIQANETAIEGNINDFQNLISDMPSWNNSQEYVIQIGLAVLGTDSLGVRLHADDADIPDPRSASNWIRIPMAYTNLQVNSHLFCNFLIRSNINASSNPNLLFQTGFISTERNIIVYEKYGRHVDLSAITNNTIVNDYHEVPVVSGNSTDVLRYLLINTGQQPPYQTEMLVSGTGICEVSASNVNTIRLIAYQPVGMSN